MTTNLVVGDDVIVHDPLGDKNGRVCHVDSDHIVIEGPRIGPTESRSWHWTVSLGEVARWVSKIDK